MMQVPPNSRDSRVLCIILTVGYSVWIMTWRTVVVVKEQEPLVEEPAGLLEPVAAITIMVLATPKTQLGMYL